MVVDLAEARRKRQARDGSATSFGEGADVAMLLVKMIRFVDEPGDFVLVDTSHVGDDDGYALTPQQARDLAAALIEAADDIDSAPYAG